MNARRLKLPWSVVFAAALTAAAFAPTQSFADPEAGREDYNMRCAACHGEKGLGDGPVAYYFTAPPPKLADLSANNGGEFPREQIISVIDGREWRDAHGGRAMPIWGEIFEAQAREALEGEEGDPEAAAAERMADLVDYIETLQR